mmetsp:Transcript_6876/g.17042  ORF Transcript_6876/g.17042 Transcript_6876/m.17042 type:complete len:354 (-) Transcript_6876:268-1329(-)
MVQSRTVQYVLMMLARTMQQCHRQTLPPLCQAMAKDLGFGMAEKGSLMGAVAVGYLLTQIPGGMLADVLGAKPTITLAIAGSTALMVATSAASSFEMLWLCVAIMGGMQGPLFPTSSVYLSRWSPPDERAKAASMLDVGVSVGSILIVPIASFLETILGWRNTYLVVAAVSAVYVLAFVVWGAESPSACKRISDEERQFLQSVVTQKKKPVAGEASAGPVGVLSHPAVLTVFFCSSCVQLRVLFPFELDAGVLLQRLFHGLLAVVEFCQLCECGEYGGCADHQPPAGPHDAAEAVHTPRSEASVYLCRMSRGGGCIGACVPAQGIRSLWHDSSFCARESWIRFANLGVQGELS